MLNPTNNNYSATKKTSKLNWIYRLFCWCAGANLKILSRLESEHNKYFGAGVLIVLVALVATFSGGYAVYTLFEEDTKIPFIIGPIWGLFIFSLDRFFVSSMIKRGRPLKDFYIALPRLFLAVFIGIIVSRPIELAIFRSEIQNELDFQKQAMIDSIDHRYTTLIETEQNKSLDSVGTEFDQEIKTDREEILRLKEEIRAEENRVDQLWDNFQCELRGIDSCRTGSGNPGYGPIAKGLEAEWKKANRVLEEKKNLNEGRIQVIENRINEQERNQIPLLKEFERNKTKRLNKLNNERDSLKTSETNRFSSSLLNRNKALATIEDRDESAYYMSFFVTILFVLLEITPVLVKLLLPKGPYDDAFLQKEEEGRRYNRLQERLSKEEFKLNSITINRLANAQREIIQKKIEDWKENELENKQTEPKGPA